MRVCASRSARLAPQPRLFGCRRGVLPGVPPRRVPRCAARRCAQPAVALAALPAALQERAAFAALAAAASVASQLETNTALGRRLSAPLLSMALAAAAAAMLPPAAVSAAAARVWEGVLPLALALALLTTDLAALRRSRNALAAFACAVAGTVVGTLAAFCAVGRALGPHGWRLAASLCSSYIGGSLNFGATAAALGLGTDAAGRAYIVAAMALDNLAMACFLGVLLGFPTADDASAPSRAVHGAAGAAAAPAEGEHAPAVTATSAAAALGAALACCAAAEAAAVWLALPGATLALVALFAAAVAAGVSAVNGLHPARVFAGAEAASSALLLLFFAALGACSRLGDALALGGAAGAFIALQLTIHLGVTLALGRLLRLPRRLLLLASNAAVGGPATAAAMASARGWHDLTPVAVMLGTLGYAVGTALGVAVGTALKVIRKISIAL
jgi:uncharacterized membrane protein